MTFNVEKGKCIYTAREFMSNEEREIERRRIWI